MEVLTGDEGVHIDHATAAELAEAMKEADTEEGVPAEEVFAALPPRKLLKNEMQAVVQRLAESPNIGAPVLHPLVKGLRRLSLEGCRYHLYYRVHPRRVVWLVRLWHMSRGAPF